MKLWTTILTAIAVLAVAAPAAFTANAMIPRDEAGAQSVKRIQPALTNVELRKMNKDQAKTIKNLNARVNTLTAQNKALKAQNSAQADTISALQRQISDLTHPQGPIVSSQPNVDPDAECLEYNVCSDEQNCRIWGYNCYLVEHPVVPAPEASEGGSGSGASDNGSSENSGSNGSDNGGSQGMGSNAGSQTGQPECATSAADPDDLSANPDSYDWSC